MRKYVRVQLADDTTSTECGGCNYLGTPTNDRLCRLFSTLVPGYYWERALRLPGCVAAEVPTTYTDTSNV